MADPSTTSPVPPGPPGGALAAVVPQRWRWWHEALLVAVVGAIHVGLTTAAHANGSEGTWGATSVALLVAGVAALPFRHRFPVGAYVVVLGATLAYWSLGYARGPIFFPLIIVLGHLVLVGRRREAVAGVITGFVGFPWLGFWIGRAEAPTLGALVLLAAWLITLVSIAEAVRSRRDRAEQVARSHAEALRRQATDERMRIARELHDVVAHNMSLISIQAGVALHLLDQRPEQARASLATIKEASKEALVELRSILGVLRQVDEEDDGPGAGDGDGAPRSPVPGLQRLGDLVERSRAAGIDVQVEVDPGVGSPADLPRPVDLAAFRIVQESLTNVAKHSDDPAAVVRIRVEDGGLAVDVLDDGSGRAGPAVSLPGAGTGIIGMRERAAAVGGRLQAGPRPGRGFAVRAWLPLPPEAEAVTPPPDAAAAAGDRRTAS